MLYGRSMMFSQNEWILDSWQCSTNWYSYFFFLNSIYEVQSGSILTNTERHNEITFKFLTLGSLIFISYCFCGGHRFLGLFRTRKILFVCQSDCPYLIKIAIVSILNNNLSNTIYDNTSGWTDAFMAMMGCLYSIRGDVGYSDRDNYTIDKY